MKRYKRNDKAITLIALVVTIVVLLILAGGYHTVVLANDGKVWTWGYNYRSQLGDETGNNSEIPICISEINSSLAGKQIVNISSGDVCTLLLDKNDQYYVYGYLDKELN